MDVVVVATTVTVGAAGVTSRIRLFVLSVINRLPPRSTATLVGLFNLAEVAVPLSPLNPIAPFPATVVMTFDLPFTLRTR